MLVVFLVLLATIIWLFISRDRYEREGDELAGQMQFQGALDKYIRSQHRMTLGGQDRILFKIGQTYEQLSDYVRANDIYFQLMREYPEGPFFGKAEARARAVFEFFLNQGGPTVVVGSNSPLVVARATFQAHYKRLVAGVAANRSGVPARLKEMYEEYRQSFQTYQKLLASEYATAVRAREADREARAEEAAARPRSAPPEPVGGDEE